MVDLGPRRQEVLRVLRTLRSGTIAELSQLLREGTLIAEGALVEVERVVDSLEGVGAELALQRMSE